MTFRTWISIITLILLSVVVFFAWREITKAWDLLAHLNIWVLLILIPVQFFSYYATGGIIFSYLRSKGNLQDVSHWTITRMALELNFVNHILPSGGAAGFSYLGWVLGRHGVRAGRATMAQIIRFAMTFIAFVGILVVAVTALIIDHHIGKVVIIVSASLAVAAIGIIVFGMYIIGSKRHLTRFSRWVTRVANKAVAIFTRGKKKDVVRLESIEGFFEDIHQDYLEIRREKKILGWPLFWAILVNISDVALIAISFLALGFFVNPATLFVAFGISAIASVFSVAPGGAGIYEAVMIAFLASAGVPADIAIAGTLLARVTLVLGTILFGYIFYQLTVIKYGKTPIQR